MIKGVQRQVIEVSRTDNEFFERALLVVRGGCTAGDDQLRQEAKRYLQRAGACSFLRRDRLRRRLCAVLLALSSAGAGAGLCFLLLR